MSREIKFRGKRLDNGKWVYGSLVQYSMPHVTPDIHDPETGMYYAVDRKTIGEYTGFKDKSGAEIFDLDLLECEDSNSDYPIYALVEWDEEYGRWKATTNDAGEYCEYELWELLLEFQFVNVAGNKFEKPRTPGA